MPRASRSATRRWHASTSRATSSTRSGTTPSLQALHNTRHEAHIYAGLLSARRQDLCEGLGRPPHFQARADFSDAVPLAQALIQANPDRVLWGTNWPHPNSYGQRPAQEVSPNLAIDDGRILDELPKWASDAAVRHKILVDNPARLYGFG